MKRIMLLGGILLTAGFPSAPVFAANITASAVISSKPDGADFDYTITLTNSSSSDSGIGTFWFGWVPGEDFLPTSPLSVTPPTGWQDIITHAQPPANDGFAIQFKAMTSAASVAPGTSLSFMFTSADTPAQIAGISPFHPGIAATTSVVFPGAPFSDAGHQFVVASVPEPSTLALGTLSIMTSFIYLRMRRKRTA
jgi:hypothetical protein